VNFIPTLLDMAMAPDRETPEVRTTLDHAWLRPGARRTRIGRSEEDDPAKVRFLDYLGRRRKALQAAKQEATIQ
jgi:hypothetical protein